MLNLDFNKIQEYIDKGLVVKRKHPNLDLYIITYVSIVQLDKLWDEELSWCRGLIVDSQNNIKAIPFKKFFNWQEVKHEIENRMGTGFTVQEKLDGSLGILFYDATSEQWILSTKGSFESEQCKKGMEILKEKYPFYNELDPDYTYLFEIIYPENRIVVTYENEDMVLLDVVQKSPLKSEGLFLNPYGYFPEPKKFNVFSIEDLIKENISNFEGYVITYADGYKVKVKLDEYVRLHKLVTGISKKAIWEWLKNGDDYRKMIDDIPDELYNWIINVVSELSYKFELIKEQSINKFASVKNLLDGTKEGKKAFAIEIKDYEYKHILFTMSNEHKNNYDADIWKLLEPKYEPFYIGRGEYDK